MASEQGVIAIIRASRPSFRNAHDKVAFAVHSSFLAAGYILTAAGTAAFSDNALTSPSTDEVGIEGWNQYDDNYAFVYAKPEKSSKNVLVKCLCMNDTLMVDALKDGDEQLLHLEINVKNHIAENGGSNYSDQYKDLGKLVASINSDILSKLSHVASTSESTKSSSVPRESADNPVHQPYNPYGSADRESADNPVYQPYNPYGIALPPVYPGIGGDDLFPAPGAGMYPSRGGIGGGSLVGPDNPLFGGRIGGQQPDFMRDRPPGVPPGARYDPYGPPDVPGFEPNRFARNPRRPGGGVHPDLEQFGRDDFI